MSTVHNAQTNTPPPSKHRLVGWAKRKRGKDGNLAADGDSDQDPRKRKLKLDVMALGKADRERLKALVKVSGYEYIVKNGVLANIHSIYTVWRQE